MVTPLKAVSLEDALAFLRSKHHDDSDYLHVATNPDLMSVLNSSGRLGMEVLRFSDHVFKYNKRHKRQERDLVLTNYAIYNFKSGHYKKPQWRLEISSLNKVALVPSGDLLLRFLNSPDYVFNLVRNQEVVDILVQEFETLRDEPLEVRQPKQESLVGIADFTRRPRETLIGRQRPASPMNLGGGRGNVMNPKLMKIFGAGNGKQSPRSTPSSATTAQKSGREEIYEGWLSKQGSGYGGEVWRRRWFVLNASTLSYFDPRTSSQFSLVAGGVVRSLWSEAPSDVVAVLEDKQKCMEFMQFVRKRNSSLFDAINCYLHINAFERLESGSPAQVKECRYIFDKFFDNQAGAADHEIDGVPNHLRLTVEKLARSGQVQTNALSGVKKWILDALDEAVFQEYLSYSKSKRTEAKLTFTFSQRAISAMGQHHSTASRHLLPAGSAAAAGDVPPTPSPADLNLEEGKHAFIYEPKRGKSITFAADNENLALLWVHTIEDVLDDFSVGRQPSGYRAEGWLEKRIGDSLVWKRSYFVLHDEKFWEYDMKHKGSIPLAGCKIQVTSAVAGGAPDEAGQVAAGSDGASPSDSTNGAQPVAGASASREDDGAQDAASAAPSTNTTAAGGGGEPSVLRPPELSVSISSSLGSGIRSPSPRGGGTGDSTGAVEPQRRRPQHRPTLTGSAASFGGFVTTSRFSYRFNLTSRKGRMYYFAADTPKLMHEWIKELQSRIARGLSGSDQSSAGGFLGIGGKTLKALAMEAPEGDVALVFTDVQSSTDLWGRVSSAMSDGLTQHDAVLRSLITRYKGFEVKTEGDAFMVSFADPLMAVQWCLAVQKDLLTVDWPAALLEHPAAARSVVVGGEGTSGETTLFAGLRVRMGVHFGKPNCRENPITHRMDYFGNPVNKSARVADSAHGGQIVCTQAVVDYLKDHTAEVLVADHAFEPRLLGDFRYKGIKESVTVFQVVPEGPLANRSFPSLRIHTEVAVETIPAAADAAATPSAAGVGLQIEGLQIPTELSPTSRSDRDSDSGASGDENPVPMLGPAP